MEVWARDSSAANGSSPSSRSTSPTPSPAARGSWCVRYRLFDAVTRLLRRVTRDRALLVVVNHRGFIPVMNADDLQRGLAEAAKG